MSDQKNEKNISDEDIELLFKQSSEQDSFGNLDESKQKTMTKTIIKKARTETSAKTLTEYSLVNFWTIILEFINILCTLIDPKKTKEKTTNPDKEQN